MSIVLQVMPKPSSPSSKWQVHTTEAYSGRRETADAGDAKQQDARVAEIEVKTTGVERQVTSG